MMATRVKTINITTKKGRNNGVFGKLYAGYGYLTDSRYSVGGNINWFNGDRRLSLIGMSNDINQQNFSHRICSGSQVVVAAAAVGAVGEEAALRATFRWGSRGVYPLRILGFQLQRPMGQKEKVKVAASYFFNQTDNTTITSLTRQYYLSHQASSLYNENDSSRSINRNHRINLRIEYTVDSNNSFIFTPKFSYQQNTQYYDLYLSYNHSYTLNANIALTEPVSANSMLQLNYTPSYTWNRSDQETDTMNHADNKFNLLDTILSDKYNNTYFTQRAGISYRYRTPSLNAALGVNGQEAILTANSTIIAGQDTLIDHTVLLHRGSQFTLPVNINGTWSASSLFTYGVAIKKMKCNFNLTAGFNYGRTPGLVNNALSLSSTYVPTGGVVLSSNISEKIDFTISYNASYNVIKNTIQNQHQQ
ncbi:unnamed protein product [Sphagnum jensenii]|uniref:Outer membrane protein beta-barrel domain-containing protein n=1 Tax=Sphagnum jensenii TaxID=128206 RepID=A0ABP0V6Z9_9BRYO